MIKPLYLFSLPRSGSTLLQRVLSSDHRISTLSEPWLLLPLLYALKSDGIFTDYSQHEARIALEDFLQQLPTGKSAYLSALSKAVLDLYTQASSEEAVYFLDKTPRYAMVASDIVEMFPEGRFIYLWRNPLSVIASMIETWGRGGWQVFRMKLDLYDGLENLLASYQRYEHQVLAVNYERFLQHPEAELQRIASYLELDLGEQMLADFAEVKLAGRMGDPTGSKRYKVLERQSLDKWKATIANPLRKCWCRRYLKWIGEDRLQLMGYDMAQMLAEIDAIPFSMRNLFSDGLLMAYGSIYGLFEFSMMKRKFKKLCAGKRIVHHA